MLALPSRRSTRRLIGNLTDSSEFHRLTAGQSSVAVAHACQMRRRWRSATVQRTQAWARRPTATEPTPQARVSNNDGSPAGGTMSVRIDLTTRAGRGTNGRVPFDPSGEGSRDRGVVRVNPATGPLGERPGCRQRPRPTSRPRSPTGDSRSQPNREAARPGVIAGLGRSATTLSVSTSRSMWSMRQAASGWPANHKSRDLAALKTQAPIDVDLGLVEAPALRLDEVVKSTWRLRRVAVSTEPARLPSPALTPVETPAREVAVQSGDVRPCLRMVEDRSIEWVIGVGASTSRQVDPPPAQTDGLRFHDLSAPGRRSRHRPGRARRGHSGAHGPQLGDGHARPYGHLFEGLDERIAEPRQHVAWNSRGLPRPGRGLAVLRWPPEGHNRRSTGVGAEGLEPPTPSL